MVLANGAPVALDLLCFAKLPDEFIHPSVDAPPVVGHRLSKRSEHQAAVGRGNGLEILPHVDGLGTKLMEFQDGRNVDGGFMQGEGASPELGKPCSENFRANSLTDRVRDKKNAMGVEDAVSRPPRRENGQRPPPLSSPREVAPRDGTRISGPPIADPEMTPEAMGKA